MDISSTRIFFKGSKTYFTSSLFFPSDVRKNVFTLYAFVRVADDYVDQAKQDPKKIKEFKDLYKKASRGDQIDNTVIENFVKLAKEKSFKDSWIEAFLKAMTQDTKKSKYKNITETLDYIYGSAEVIGLMMAQIMDLDPKSHKYAKMLGRSMQYANFLRDIDEDNTLNRQYIPTTQLRKHGLKSLEKDTVMKDTDSFKKLMNEEVNRFEKWQMMAEKGFSYIPKRYLVAIKTASDMYKWTISEINKNPLIVFEKKIKPTRIQILSQIIKNFFDRNIKYNVASNVFLLDYIIS